MIVGPTARPISVIVFDRKEGSMSEVVLAAVVGGTFNVIAALINVAAILHSKQ